MADSRDSKPAILSMSEPKRPAGQTPVGPRPAAIVSMFDTPRDLYRACEGLRDAGYKEFDAHTPFAVHGLEKAMGLAPSKLPWIVILMGATGLASAVLMMWWMGGVDYPLNISGKPSFALASSIPIMFELTVLFSAFGCFFGMWGLNRLPKFYDPVFKHPSFGRASDDKFFISVPVEDPKFDRLKTRELLERLGGREVEEVTP
ncbi:MAG: DUF3341 domain-containing protein [Polyangiales bacterium]